LVNWPGCSFLSYHPDRAMRDDGNHGSRLQYEPNRQGEWKEHPDFSEPPLALEGASDRFDYWEDEPDYFTQAGDLFRLMTPEQQQVLFDNTARNMTGVPDAIKQKHAYHCQQADPAYGEGVAKALGVELPK